MLDLKRLPYSAVQNLLLLKRKIHLVNSSFAQRVEPFQMHCLQTRLLFELEKLEMPIVENPFPIFEAHALIRHMCSLKH